MNKRLALLVVFVCAVSVSSTAAWGGVALQSFDVIGSGPAVTPSLFASIGTQAVTPHTGVTSWPVTIDVAGLGALPPSLVMNFPDRASAT